MVMPTITTWSTLIGAVRRTSRGWAEEVIGREAYVKPDLFAPRNGRYVAAGLQTGLTPACWRRRRIRHGAAPDPARRVRPSPGRARSFPAARARPPCRAASPAAPRASARRPAALE